MSRQQRQPNAAAITAAALNSLQQPPLPQGPQGPQPPLPNSPQVIDVDMGEHPGTSGNGTGTNSIPMAGLNLTGPNIVFEKVSIRPKEIVCDSLPMEMITKRVSFFST